ncbi:MAG: acyloxyacyl hydrolase [Bacteroidota bacterium]
MKQQLVLTFLYLCLGQNIVAQDSAFRFKLIGATSGYGREVQMDEKYQPIFFAADLVWQMGRGGQNKFFAFYLEPQFNLVLTAKPVDFEVGSNIGLRYFQKLSASFYLYEMLGSGPHYMSAVIPKQASGFLFSDNLGIGFLKRFNEKKRLFLNFQLFVRHLSNANFRNPNGGINTLNIRVGLSKQK